MRPARRLPLVAPLLLLLGGCPLEVTPYGACRALDDGCCANEDCGPNAVCDFDYFCDRTWDGAYDCTRAAGDRSCHSACAEDEDCEQGLACFGVEQTQGAEDGSNVVWACF